ncbi:MAG: HD domain-containing protein [Patescibacteria group bacterium]
MKNNIKKSLDGIYQFMSHSYNGNWQYRWYKTPYLETNIKVSKNESILGHQWACMGFWFYLKHICPSLSTLVDTTEIYERLLGHDLGETFIGDIPLFLQLSGKGTNKHSLERKEIQKMGKKIPKKIFKIMIKYFDEFENPVGNITKLEILIAKFIDTMQGNHFAFVFGNDLPKHETTINKIVNRSFIPVAKRLLKVLKQRGHKKAYKEVVNIVIHHLEFAKKAGVKIDFDFYSK